MKANDDMAMKVIALGVILGFLLGFAAMLHQSEGRRRAHETVRMCIEFCAGEAECIRACRVESEAVLGEAK